ncbi:cAMP-binding domain of CRP or a regulatory subunit of cAMP-dependent protein kinases [Enhydrobacter aerosaccus]|uniref:cAMP-binding domain of CRP or a regulatory subunit of cAMP-dependent protein kinases n=1 Tax=Enhydrobacter aerosaccus TaxID=225324 RepID=A0A1T4T1D5_9HYPH|nr:Crp/Fnr family transcriptional regulator [Enhydrobacter aerosaccus]SKA34179.1 cAMP-binding domain of CRP or a regulatory subunit of cAMP-dependent protein kinases [Enhydrobacter aerosaccus]
MTGPIVRASPGLDATMATSALRPRDSDKGKQQPYRNVLLRSLPEADLKELAKHLQPVALTRRLALETPGAAISNVVFPESGVVSILARAPRDRRIEVGLVGFDGMTGFTALLGDNIAINETIVQVAGDGWRISTAALLQLTRGSPTLLSALLRYVHAFMAQSMQTALANGSAKLEERVARWLLMSHDRVHSDELALTHDFLAQMLGVRRAGVTIALQILESKRLIRARRSLITILDRAGLKRQANGSYGAAETVYDRLFRPDWRTAAD